MLSETNSFFVWTNLLKAEDEMSNGFDDIWKCLKWQEKTVYRRKNCLPNRPCQNL
jgi:hypothetical protein